MAADEVLFFTELVGLSVFDTRNRRIGRVKDAALVPLIDSARVDRFLIGGGFSWLTIRYDQVRSIAAEGIYLKDEQLTPYHSDEYMLRIVRDLLDQQIIDSHGRKVVRVTDVTFEIHHERERDVLRVIEVDIGIRSIFRRLVQGVVPARWVRKLQGPIPPNSISWEYCNIVEADPQRRLRLNISNDALEKMHPADLADIVEELGPEDREAIMETMDAEAAAEALSEMDPDVQASILEALEPEKAADIIEEMDPDEAAHALAQLEEQTSQEILEEMTTESKTDVREIIEYDEDTAGFLMNTEFVSVPETAAVADALVALRANEELIENLNTIFIVDADERLIGTVPIARLFLAGDQQPIKELAQETTIFVSAAEGQDRVAELFDKYNVLTLPVLDKERRLAGVVTADDVITLLRQR